MKTTLRDLRDLMVVRSALPPTITVPDIVRDTGQDTDADESAQDTASDMPVMTVRFSAFGVWYPIRSFWEGEFMERVMPGAFKKTITERGSQVKVLFNHGMELSAPGEMVLGVPSVLEEREDSPYAEVPLLDTSYNRDLAPGLAANAYGSSFMFQVLRDEWNEEPDASEHNPKAWPERSILEVRLMEFGPVTWPANPSATAGLRSGTDWYASKLRYRRPERFESLTGLCNDFRALHGLRTPMFDAATPGTSDERAAITPTDAPDTTPVVHHPNGLSQHARSRLLAAPFLNGGPRGHSEGAA